MMFLCGLLCGCVVCLYWLLCGWFRGRDKGKVCVGCDGLFVLLNFLFYEKGLVCVK